MTEFGEVFNRTTGRCLRNLDSNDGYLNVRLRVGGDTVSEWVHRLVAKAFVPNPRPDIFTQVDHVDRNEKHNNATNLRWLSRQLNQLNSDALGRSFNKHTKKWEPRLWKNGKQIYLGRFNTFLEGHRVYRAARQKLFDEIYARQVAEGLQALEFLP